MTIEKSLQEAQLFLAPISETPRLDAELLLAHVLKQARSFLYARPEKELSYDEVNQFNCLIKRRHHREPIAYILNSKEFWSLNLFVNEHTLIPRPETELLIELALRLYDKTNTIKVADLGTGSGAIALALARECCHWKIFATDISAQALQIAAQNAHQLNVNNVQFYQGEWCHALPEKNFNLIISNPPYIAEIEWNEFRQDLAFEPQHALLSGKDGLDAIRKIIHQAFNLLTLGGYLLLEHGYQQSGEVRKLLKTVGYQQIFSFYDKSGRERATLGSR